MFGLCKKMDKNLKKLKFHDYQMVKLVVFLFTLFLVTAWEGFHLFVLSIEWYVYLGAVVLLSIPLAMKMLKK